MKGKKIVALGLIAVMTGSMLADVGVHPAAKAEPSRRQRAMEERWNLNCFPVKQRMRTHCRR